MLLFITTKQFKIERYLLCRACSCLLTPLLNTFIKFKTLIRMKIFLEIYLSESPKSQCKIMFHLPYITHHLFLVEIFINCSVVSSFKVIGQIIVGRLQCRARPKPDKIIDPSIPDSNPNQTSEVRKIINILIKLQKSSLQICLLNQFEY